MGRCLAANSFGKEICRSKVVKHVIVRTFLVMLRLRRILSIQRSSILYSTFNVMLLRLDVATNTKNLGF